MKILQVINSMGTGGAEKLLLESIPFYRAAGIEMDLLVFWNNNHQFINALKALNCCKIIVLKESPAEKSVYNPLNIFKLRKYLKKYDIAHVHLFPAQYYAVFANMLNGNSCKLIFTEHCISNGRINKKWLLPLERFTYARYEKIVCISEEIKIVFMGLLKLNAQKFVLIKNGINCSAIENAVPLPVHLIHPQLNESDQIILQVSAFRPQKDQMTAIRAIHLLQNPQIKLLLVGDGICRSDCEALVKELGLENRVLFLGQRMDIPRLLKSAKIVVLSSQFEGLSLSSIEGMISGSPFIASAVPGLIDIVEGAGVLFEFGNEKDLELKITELLTDNEYYEQVVKRCKKRGMEYDIQNMVQEHISLYQTIVDN